jgi:hypothetical protein
MVLEKWLQKPNHRTSPTQVRSGQSNSNSYIMDATQQAAIDGATGGLFGCMGDPSGFACSLFIPCCAVGQTAANTMEALMGVPAEQAASARNTTACYYLCCCPCMGCAAPSKNGEPSASCVVHAGKWFFCHPCYVSQGLRASKMALDFKNKVGKFTNIAGAPDCNDMER